MSHAIVSFNSPSTCSGLHVASAAPAATASSFSATTPAIRGTGNGPPVRHAGSLGLERVAHRLQARRATRTARRRRSSTRGRARRRRRLGEQHALHEVARVDHRSALRARPDEREPAAADRGEELRLALGLERSVEPRRAHDDGREVAAVEAALHELLGFELRPPVGHVRARTASPRRSGRRSIGSPRTASSTRRARTAPRRPGGRGRARAAYRRRSRRTSSRTQRAGMDDRRRVDHRRVADAVEELVDRPPGRVRRRR